MENDYTEARRNLVYGRASLAETAASTLIEARFFVDYTCAKDTNSKLTDLSNDLYALELAVQGIIDDAKIFMEAANNAKDKEATD